MSSDTDPSPLLDPDSSTGLTINFLFAVAFAAVALWNAWMGLADLGSKDWPTTIGTITATKTQYSWLDMTRHHNYVVDVRYIYDVNGKYYSGTTEYHGFRNQHKADAAASAYRNGSSMMVHYNPYFNFESTLSPGSRAPNFFFAMVTWGFFTLACLFPKRRNYFARGWGTGTLP